MKGPRAKRSKSQFARNTFFTDTQMCRKQPNRSPKVEIDNSQELYGVRQSLGKTFHLREQNDRGRRLRTHDFSKYSFCLVLWAGFFHLINIFG